MSEEQKVVLGQDLTLEERIVLAQLVQQPGWKVLVRLMAEECKAATEAVIRLDPSGERYDQKLIGLQTTARAMNKFSAEVLKSVKLHEQVAVKALQREEKPDVKPPKRFQMVVPKNPPTEGAKQN
jgi:hypothetical protein